MSNVMAELLASRIQEASRAYYNSAAVMSDSEFDALVDELRVLDPDHDVLKDIGARVPEDSPWTKFRHPTPMSSLNKVNEVGELNDWFRGCGLPSTGLLFLSDKGDGISIKLIYKGGSLMVAATRGDGEIGEDITRNVIKMKGVVHRIPNFSGEVRGEIVLLKDDHATHFPEYANPRNAASGIAKRLDGVGCEHLTVLTYQIINHGGRPIPTKEMEFQVLTKLGFRTVQGCMCGSPADVKAVYDEYVDRKRAATPYDIDGLVVEVNDTAFAEGLGDLNKRPKGAVAYKFPHEIKPTILRQINWQVGNSGRVTPVAIFDPVQLAGARVSQASLHNIGNILRIRAGGLREGEHILVSRRNDVIPYVEKVVVTPGAPDPKAVIPTPTVCPTCGTQVVMDGEYLICRNEDCPAQVAGGVKRWVKKIGLLGWGDTIIETLCEQGLVHDPADLYKLRPDQLAAVQMDGRRIGSTATVILDELKAKGMELPLHILVGSLGIPLCSRSICKMIADAGFDTMDKMRQARMIDIAAIPGMGAIKADAFVKGLASKTDLINRLLAVGVKIKAKAVGNLSGKSVCLTGFRDPDMERAIEAAGGSVAGSVGRGLSYLVTKDPSSTSGKAEKARQYGVRIVGIDEMWTILRG